MGVAKRLYYEKHIPSPESSAPEPAKPGPSFLTRKERRRLGLLPPMTRQQVEQSRRSKAASKERKRLRRLAKARTIHPRINGLQFIGTAGAAVLDNPHDSRTVPPWVG